LTDIAQAIAVAIRAAAPGADASSWSQALAQPMLAAAINTPKRIAMFVGQCAVESGGFKALAEDLYYTHAANLRGAFPSHFPVGLDPSPYLCNPELLGSYVYANLYGNGPPASGDGYRYRGRGLIDVTFRDQYEEFAASEDRAVDDELLAWMETPPGAAKSACWYWTKRAIQRAADNWIVTDATRLINPALIGINDRIDLCNRALAALSAWEPAKPAAVPPPAAPVPVQAPSEAAGMDATQLQRISG